MRYRLMRALPALLIGVLFALGIIIWYKQYTYFNFAGDELTMADEAAQGYAIGATDAGFAVDASYPEQVSCIIFWANQYHEISFRNASDTAVRITVAGYNGTHISTLPEPVVVPAGEELYFVADGHPGYVISAYAAERDALSPAELIISHNNHAYMDRWKKAIYALLGAVVGWTAIWTVLLFLTPRRGRAYAVYASLVVGAAGCVIAEYAYLHRMEPWMDGCITGLAVFMGVLALGCAAYREKTEVLASPEKRVKAPELWGGIAAIIAMLVFFGMLTSREGTILWSFNSSNHANTKDYVIVMLIFLAIFFFLGQISLPQRYVERVSGLFSGKLALCAAFLIVFALTRHFVYLVPYISGWRGQLVFWVCFALLFSLLWRFGDRFWIPKWLFPIFYGIIILFAACNQTFIDLWDTGIAADPYHAGWHYSTIYNIAFGKPFYGGRMDLYGHYALFYKLPLLLFGNNLRTIGIVTGIAGGLAMLFALYSAHQLIRSDMLRLFVALSLLSSVTIRYFYPMTHPHRMLFPFMLLAYGIWKKKNGLKRWDRYLGYLIALASVLWNTETGLICALAWAVYLTLYHFNEKGQGLADVIRLLLKEIPWIIAEIAGAYLIIKIYNTAVSDVSFWQELFLWKKETGVLLDQEFMDANQNVLFRWANGPWLYILLFFMLLVVYMFAKTAIFGSDGKRVAEEKVLMLVLAIGLFTDWMARPEDYLIIQSFLALMIAVSLDEMLRGRAILSTAMDTKKIAFLLIFAMLCFGQVAYLLSLRDTVDATKGNLLVKRIWDYDALCEHIKEFEAEVPKETYAEGWGLRMIYLELGWEMENEGWGEGKNPPTEDMEYYLCDSLYLDAENFELEKTLPFGSMTYYLYRNTQKTP